MSKGRLTGLDTSALPCLQSRLTKSRTFSYKDWFSPPASQAVLRMLLLPGFLVARLRHHPLGRLTSGRYCAGFVVLHSANEEFLPRIAGATQVFVSQEFTVRHFLRPDIDGFDAILPSHPTSTTEPELNWPFSCLAACRYNATNYRSTSTTVRQLASRTIFAGSVGNIHRQVRFAKRLERWGVPSINKTDFGQVSHL